jgi:hypothetical protein
MTLPLIAARLAQLSRPPESFLQPEAKALVYEAIERDLASGVAWLRDIAATTAFRAYVEECIHCWLPEIATRKQVVRLAVYGPLQAYVEAELGLYVRLHNFRLRDDDGSPSGRILIMPAAAVEALQGTERWPLSPAHTWQVMNWLGAKPPERLPQAEAHAALWRHAQVNLAEGLAHLKAAAEAGEEGLDGSAHLIPQLIQLIGVPGMRQVVEAELRQPFQLYNCCKGVPTKPGDSGTITSTINWVLQLKGQAKPEMLDC